MNTRTAEPSRPSLIDPNYLALPGHQDEMLDAARAIRPHWQPFLDSMRQLGLAELSRRWAEANHLIREHGITYNVYGDPRGQQRPWQLDPIPLLLPAAEAARLEAGLVQRARLFDAILADLYGAQRLLHEGMIPPELIFANPAYLRACHHIPIPHERRLHLVAANLARGPAGHWWCLGDRTQAPSGAGYALENRIVLSRSLPDVFHDCRVERLARFFHDFRDHLRSLTPMERDGGPRIVLLTPGPYNETYFEHAFLASYLGFTLVEGTDLTVRDGRVYLKLLGGLQPVDVILRRLDDDFCDPLELRADSFLGVPGLVQAVRAGNVAVVNALGSGLVESPAWLAYLPGLCRSLLGEELRLPSVPTWWCGQDEALKYVIDHLDQLTLKPTFSTARQERVFGDRLTANQRRQLVERLRARPGDWVAQEILPLGAAPVLADGRLEPRLIVLRTFLTARNDSFAMMPGGLTRFSTQADQRLVSMQSGGGSKDTWVLAVGEVNPFSLLPATGRPVELSRAGSDLPSRVADNLFWLGRYTERAEGLTRLLRGVFIRLTERSGLGEVQELPILAQALPSPAWPPAAHLAGLVLDHDRDDSLAAVAAAARRTAGAVRDRISVDMWRVLSELDQVLHRGSASKTPADLLDRLDRAVLILAGFGGLAIESMTRGVGWRFLDMGRRLERALYTLHLLKHTLGVAPPSEGPLLEALLEIADSSMTYRRRYQGSLQTAAVLDLLLTDDTNPRSVLFQIRALADDVQALPSDSDRPGQVVIDAAFTTLRLADVNDLALTDESGHRPFLLRTLGQLAESLPELSAQVGRRYLTHLLPSRHLGGGAS